MAQTLPPATKLIVGDSDLAPLDVRLSENKPPARCHLLTLCLRSIGSPDGIRDYAVRLVEALNGDGGIEAEVLWRSDDGSWGHRSVVGAESSRNGRRISLLSMLIGADVVLVQYNPFLFGRWGFAPWLPLMLLRLRLSPSHPRIVLMVHERFVDMTEWRSTLMGIWQRLQLIGVRFSADMVFVSTEAWTERLTQWSPRRPTYHLPIGSNLPDGRCWRDKQRQSIGASHGAIVLATFGQNRPSQLKHCIAEATNSLVEEGRRVILLNLGANATPLVGLHPAVIEYSPGHLPAHQVARWLSAADVYLAPFSDGASTRRTTLMAAMQHGLPIVATDGPLTDTILRASGALILIPLSRLDQFPQEVRRLVASRQARRDLGMRARDLYARHFDWPVTTARLLGLLRQGSPSARQAS